MKKTRHHLYYLAIFVGLFSALSLTVMSLTSLSLRPSYAADVELTINSATDGFSIYDSGSVTVARFMGSRLVGIGTSTPASTLAVVGTSTFIGGNVAIGTSTVSSTSVLTLDGVSTSASQALAITGTSTFMGGNVGIGAAASENALTVLGGIKIDTSVAPGTTTDTLYISGGALFFNGSQTSNSSVSTEYLFAQLAGLQNSNIVANDHVKFDTVVKSSGSSITLDTSTTYTPNAAVASIGRFTLASGKTYRLSAGIPWADGTANEFIRFKWYDATNGANISQAAINVENTVGSSGGGGAIFTTTSDTLVELRVVSNNSDGVTQIGHTTDNLYPWAIIEKIADPNSVADFTAASSGSAGVNGLVITPSAGDQGAVLLGNATWSGSNTVFVDTTNARMGIGTDTPGTKLTVVGTSTFMTGNVGIGTTTPATDLDINGTIAIRGGSPALNSRLESDATGLASWKAPVTLRAKQSVASQTLGTTFEDITGCSITLPSAGTYRVAYYARAGTVAEVQHVTFQLYNQTAGAALADTEAIGFILDLNPNVTSLSFQAMASMETFITITSATEIRLQGLSTDGAGTSLDDGNGRTVIVANRL